MQIKGNRTMNFKTRLIMTAGAMAMAATTAFAAIDTDALVQQLQDQGFTRIEVKIGMNRVKVEAINGDQKVEVVYDSATGAILKQEASQVEDSDDDTPGVEIKRSFIGSLFGHDDGNEEMDDEGDDHEDGDDQGDDDSNDDDPAGDDGNGDDHDDNDDDGGDDGDDKDDD